MISVIKKSAQYAFAIVTGVSTVASLCNYTLRDSGNISLCRAVIILLSAYLLLWAVIFLCYLWQRHRPYATKINGKSVQICVGDIFKEQGLKVIPFNERFDTQVDDVIIAHRTLNGMMIDYHVSDREDLKKRILDAQNDKSNLTIKKAGVYPLGRIIPYNDFLMLAFTHFDSENKAYINISEYEQVLLRMWSEIRRVYAGKEVVLPLLGSGITNIDGLPYKDFTELLKCILCTFRRSKFEPIEGIKIVLTDAGIRQIDMNKIKEIF